MEKMVSKWYNNSQPLPQEYIFPPDQRPRDEIKIPGSYSAAFCLVFLCGIPPIRISRDIENKKLSIVSQVINHGVDDKLLGETMDVIREFFDLPDEDNASLYSDDPRKPCKLCTSSIKYINEKIHYWRDNLRHPCNPLADHIGYWPEKPAKYRYAFGVPLSHSPKLLI